ncbi:DUF3551 domain-containing protein [Bradyrhizobium sp. Ec3.3]|uniref:DUF3551 domain-containing protein n=1 Tax=Bradyrhizobium sp. Ec3.3 TaxID=189753 RepID=UPI000427C364|nr:DUF3551 domain-containing protein [Bradyrhizobium sp. Ec3.3]
MRTPFLTLIAIAALQSAAPAEAQTFDPRYPVCMHVYTSGGFGGDYYDCSFASIPQCRASASGRAANCDVNPYHAFNAPPPARHSRYNRVD